LSPRRKEEARDSAKAKSYGESDKLEAEKRRGVVQGKGTSCLERGLNIEEEISSFPRGTIVADDAPVSLTAYSEH